MVRVFVRSKHLTPGTPDAIQAAMAAVFALVFLFVLAAGGLLMKVFVGEGSFASIFALITFMALAWGVFFGLFRLSREWEGPESH